MTSPHHHALSPRAEQRVLLGFGALPFVTTLLKFSLFPVVELSHRLIHGGRAADMLDGAVAFGLGVGIAGTFVTVFAQRGFRARSVPPKTRPRCKAVQLSATFRPDGDPRSIQTSSTQKYSAVTLTELADALSGSRERPVLDRTELSGRFDVELDYAWQPVPPAALDPRAVAATLGGAPTLAEAMREQLGLRLRRERNRVEVMIVRSVERARSDEN